MSVLGTQEIKRHIKEGLLGFSTFPEDSQKEQDAWLRDRVKGASIDLPLGTVFYVPKSGLDSGIAHNHYSPVLTSVDINASNPEEYFDKLEVPEGKGIVLKPGAFILGMCTDIIKLPNNLAAKLYSRSSAGRWGLDMCLSAGWIDPGYSGILTLEIRNFNNRTVFLKTGISYCQLVLEQVTGTATGYRGHYQDETGSMHQLMLPKPIR